MQATAQPEEYF